MTIIKVTKEIEKNIIYSYLNEDNSVGSITAKFGISKSLLYRYLHKANIQPGRRSDKQEEQIRRLYVEEKLSEPEIAIRLKLCRMTVSHRVRALGINRTSQESLKLRGTTPSGSAHWNWRGGMRKMPNRAKSGNYILLSIPNHPRANKRGYVAEHILVWEEYHKRTMPKGYVIHHLNGVSNDNRADNLVAMPRAGHSRREQGEPYKKRIRQLEIENRQLRKALDNSQMIFTISEN